MAEMFNEAFNQISVDDRVAGTSIETDASLAATPSSTTCALIIGQRLSTGRAAVGEVTLVPGASGGQAADLFGRGSMLHNMVRGFRANNSTMPLYCIALDDDDAGVAAKQDVTVVGVAAESGTIVLWVHGASLKSIGDTKVNVGVTAGDTAKDIAATMVAAINGKTDLMVTAKANGDVVTITSRHKGAVFNELRIQHSLSGVVGGEYLPAGVSLTIPNRGYLAGGVTNPNIATAIAAMTDVEFDHILMPYADATNLNAMDVEMARRWHPNLMAYGYYLTGDVGTLSELSTFGKTRNGSFGCNVGGYGRPSPSFMTAARLLGQMSSALFNHPARPLIGLTLVGEMAEPESETFDKLDKNLLLWSGVSVLDRTREGTVVVNRIVTMYQTNAAGDTDEAWMDITTVTTNQYVNRDLKSFANRQWILRRSILIEDGDQVDNDGDDPIPVVSPRQAKGSLIGRYDYLRRKHIVSNTEEFSKRLVVSKVGTRMNVKYPSNLADPLQKVAVQNQFYLDFPDY